MAPFGQRMPVKRVGLCRLLVLLITALPLFALAQPSRVQRNAGLRYEIDAKRGGVNLNSDDALPRSREFLRIDSTYYVGWLYEGSYKFNHAADYLGFRNAATPLERCLALLERDYRKELATRTSDLMTYIPVFKYQVDYAMATQYLLNCYNNAEEPNKAYALLRRYLKWNFQKDFFDAYNYLMWVTHRNRFYTRDKYPFLRNTIDDNEQLANAYLDSNLVKIRRNTSINSAIFPPSTAQQEILGVYHYKSILFSYAFKADSSEKYFGLMRDAGMLPHNNYATFRATMGDFRTAESEYQLASQTDGSDKRLQEWAYYTSILDIYKGAPKQGAQLSRDMIRAAGSTPGFGWYNIALARCQLYDGQISEAERTVNKAAEFKELHIGTTLGQSHYDFSIQLNKLMARIDRVEMQRFENKNWWYNPMVLGRMASLTGEKFLQQFLIVNQFAQNPERDRVIYKLFSTESTVAWDEVWYLIGDFSTNYFLDRFQKELQTDNRKYVRKYFQYFVTRLKMKQGKWDDAKQMLTAILNEGTTDESYEKLFTARVYQALATVADEQKQEGSRDDFIYRMTQTYPQLVPFSGLKPNLRLVVSGTDDKIVTQRLRACNINWITSASTPTMQAYMVFQPAKGNLHRIEYWVTDASGNFVVPRQSCTYETKNAEGAGISMAYRLFGVGGKQNEGGSDSI